MFALLLTLIFLRPFISSLAFPYANFIHSLALGVTLIGWILLNFRERASLKFLKYPLFLFCLSLALSFCFSLDKAKSFSGSYMYLLAFLLIFFSASLHQKGRDILLKILIFSGLLVSIFALYQYAFGFRHILAYMAKERISDPFALDYISRQRVFLPFVTPNALAGYLIMILPLSCVRKTLRWITIPLSLALLLTGSIGAFISLLLALSLSLRLYKKPRGAATLGILGLLACIAIFLIARSLQQGAHIKPVFSGVMRLNYWRESWEAIRDYGLSGMGIGNFNMAYSRYAHNSYLQLWAEAGILSLVSLLWLSGSIIKKASAGISVSFERDTAAALITSASAFFIHNFIDFTFFLPEVSFIWWLLMGLCCSAGRKEPQALRA